MNVILSADAQSDIRAIRNYIAVDGELYAEKMIDRLEAALNRIGQFPQAGRPTRHTNTREVIVAPYVIRYRIGKKQIEVTRIHHGKQYAP